MFIPGNILEHPEKQIANAYTCEITLNVGTVICARDCYAECLQEKREDDSCALCLYLCLNQAMSLGCVDGIFYLYVHGPDGGYYFKLQTDLSKDEFGQLVAFLKKTL